MTEILNFNEMGIEADVKGFTGDHIKITRLFNKPIIVYEYKVGPSKYEGQRLDMQIEVDGVKKVTWTGSTKLIEVIQKVKHFPFRATIIEENECYKFT